MSQQIIILTGKKQSGKTSASNFIHGLAMLNSGSCKECYVDDLGRLSVNYEDVGDDGSVDSGLGVIDLERRDSDFINYATENIWPYVRSYSYADVLKSICIEVFGLTYEQCYGTDDQKNTFTSVKWSDIAWSLPPRTKGNLKKSGEIDNYMTAREFMQQFGTNICRKIKNDCWIRSCLNRVVREGSELAIITDGRFPNEVEIAKEYNAKTIRLARNPFEDEHESETALDHLTPEDYDFYLDNSDMTMKHKNDSLLEKFKEWGMFPNV